MPVPQFGRKMRTSAKRETIMNRRHFFLSLGVALAAAPMARAQTFAEQIVQQLADQGFSNIQVETTLLGRIRIVAAASVGHREIILNPRTGEILRDIWFDAAGNQIGPRIVNAPVNNGNSGSGSDQGGDDNSGSDGGDDNSGSGSGDDKEDEKRGDQDD